MSPVVKRLLSIVILSTFIGTLPVLLYLELSVSSILFSLMLMMLIGGSASVIVGRRLSNTLMALDVGLQNFKDGEFSSTLAISSQDELGELCALYNEVAEHLRREKQWIYQRELMLDKVLQSSPDVLFLVNDQGLIVFSNWSARHFFNYPSRLEGAALSALLARCPSAVADTINTQKEGLFTISGTDSEQQVWHAATGKFLLNNQQHRLYILKQLTREMSRQEAAVWKKVIRIISHELNNSLGPISSMLHSGRLLSERMDEPRLGRVFSTIEERIQHLNQFVQDYGKFAKLPAPNLQAIDWLTLIEQLQSQWTFCAEIAPNLLLNADPVQLEQLLINLLKNAHESGSSPEDILVLVKSSEAQVVIDVCDRGKGMSDNVMTSALIPFYSTKASGSGLGLALCREITDAHNGHISLINREQGGLCVRVSLPQALNNEGANKP